MKKIPVMLGALAGILAIAGAFTTKGSSKVVFNTGFTRSGGTTSTDCTVTTGAHVCTVSGVTVFTASNLLHSYRTNN